MAYLEMIKQDKNSSAITILGPSMIYKTVTYHSKNNIHKFKVFPIKHNFFPPKLKILVSELSLRNDGPTQKSARESRELTNLSLFVETQCRLDVIFWTQIAPRKAENFTVYSKFNSKK